MPSPRVTAADPSAGSFQARINHFFGDVVADIAVRARAVQTMGAVEILNGSTFYGHEMAAGAHGSGAQFAPGRGHGFVDSIQVNGLTIRFIADGALTSIQRGFMEQVFAVATQHLEKNGWRVEHFVFLNNRWFANVRPNVIMWRPGDSHNRH
jgi:hypothetical protein